MDIDWSAWGPPLGVVVFGGIAGYALLLSSVGGDGNKQIDVEARRLDLENTHRDALQALKHLETEREKLPAADYEAERARLMARGARALEALDRGTSAAPVPTPPAAASAPVNTAQAAAPSVGIGPEWKGALYALAAAALVAVLWTTIRGQEAPRGSGSMTGNLPNEAPGGGPAMKDPTQNPEFKARAAELEAALQANPKDVGAMNELTQLYLSHGVPATAFDWSKKALETDPNDRDARTYRGVLTAMMGMLDQGVTQLDGVLAEDPNHQLALVYKGLILLELKRLPESAAALEKALAQDPDNEMLASALAQAKGGGGAPPAAAGGDLLVSGTLDLDPAARSALTGKETLFFSLGTGTPGTPPVAADRRDGATFPMPFQLTTAQIRAMGGGDVPPVMEFKARLDGDGNAMTKEPGLPLAIVTGVAKGTSGLVVTLTLDGTPRPSSGGAAPAPGGNGLLAPLQPAGGAPGPTAEVLVSGRAVLGAGQAALGNETVFVSVKDPAGGPPLAVKKLSPGFPLDFQVTRADLIQMGGGARPLPAQFTVSVRLDRDGNATTKDGPAAEATGVNLGASGLSLTLQ